MIMTSPMSDEDAKDDNNDRYDVFESRKAMMRSGA